MIKVTNKFKTSPNGFTEVTVDPITFSKITGSNGMKKLPFKTHADTDNGGGLYDFLVDGYQVLVKRIQTDKVNSEGNNIWRTQPYMKTADANKLYSPVEKTSLNIGVFA